MSKGPVVGKSAESLASCSHGAASKVWPGVCQKEVALNLMCTVKKLCWPSSTPLVTNGHRRAEKEPGGAGLSLHGVSQVIRLCPWPCSGYFMVFFFCDFDLALLGPVT